MRRLTPIALNALTGCMLGVLMLFWLVSSQTLNVQDLPGGSRAWYPLLAHWTNRLEVMRLCALTTILAQLALWLWLLERSGVLDWLLAVRLRRLEGQGADPLRFGLLAFLTGSLAGTVVQHLGLGMDDLAILVNMRSIVLKILAGCLLGYAALMACRGAFWRLQAARPAAALGLGLAFSLVPWQQFLERLVFGTGALVYGPWAYLAWTASWLGLLGGGLSWLTSRPAEDRAAALPEPTWARYSSS